VGIGGGVWGGYGGEELKAMWTGETRATGKVLQSWQWIRQNVGIRDVARELGLTIKGNRIRCPRRANHRHGDANPSMTIGTKNNKVFCYVCGGKPESNIDLVMLVLGIGAKEAVAWIAERWQVKGTVAQQITKTRPTVYSGPRLTIKQQAEFAPSYKSLPTRHDARNLYAYIWSPPEWDAVPATTLKVLLSLWRLASRSIRQGEPPFCINHGQRALAKMIRVQRPTIRKALEFGRKIGLLENDQGFRSSDPELRRAAYIRFTPYSDTFGEWKVGSKVLDTGRK